MVTNRAMRPGTISTGMRKPMKLAIVKRKVGKYMFTKNRAGLLSRIMVNPLVEKVSFVSLLKYVPLINFPQKCQIFHVLHVIQALQ